MASTQPKLDIVVIGIGNAHRNDDGVGIVVARRLGELAIDGLTILEESGEGTSLIDAWGEAGLVIIIDAVRSGAEPGVIHRFDATSREIPAHLFSYSTHAFGVAGAIGLAHALGRLPRRLIVYGIEGRDFESGTTLTSEVEAVVPLAVKAVVQEIENHSQVSVPTNA